jgi:hypothetical protein
MCKHNSFSVVSSQAYRPCWTFRNHMALQSDPILVINQWDYFALRVKKSHYYWNSIPQLDLPFIQTLNYVIPRLIILIHWFQMRMVYWAFKQWNLEYSWSNVVISEFIEKDWNCRPCNLLYFRDSLYEFNWSYIKDCSHWRIPFHILKIVVVVKESKWWNRTLPIISSY